MDLFCPHLSECGGCHFDRLPYLEQTKTKISHLESCFKEAGLKFPDIQFLSLGENFLRHRFDFTIENGKMGLYGKDKSIVDLKVCYQITPELQKAFEDFRKVQFPIRKGSVRLRIGPNGQRGAWLDFANVDIKNLLEDGKAFQQLFDLGFQVEIGQKGKSLRKINGFFKLVDPVYENWFETELKNYVSLQLKTLISSFTQPSWITAKAMVQIVQKWILNLKKDTLHICEFGAGIGQFTLPLLSYGHEVDVYEIDESATHAVRLNAESANLNANLNIYCGDFQKKSLEQVPKYDLAVLNPPRSGLKNFVHEITKLQTKNCIYISCFPESLALDLKSFLEKGYIINEVIIVDQFPQTKHYETCVLLQGVDLNA